MTQEENTQNVDLFNNESTDEPPVPIDPDKDYYQELVGEGRRFKDEHALARAKAESDTFIERIKTENAQLRQELNQRITLEEFYDRVSRGEPRHEDGTNHNRPNGEGNEQTDALKAEDIEELVNTRFNQVQEQERRNQNARHVKDELTRRFGSDYLPSLKAVAQETELTEADLTQLAQTRPKAFLRLVDNTNVSQHTRTEGPNAPPSNRVNTSMPKADAGRRNFAHYQKLRKENERAYWSPRVQNEMYKEAERQGESFYQ